MNTTTFNFTTQPTDILEVIVNRPVVVGTVVTFGASLFWCLSVGDEKQIKTLRGWPIIGQWKYFTKRYDFLSQGFRSLPSETLFGFNILKYNVVAMRGENARKVFFDHRDLSFSEGYRLLFGGAPQVTDVVKNMPEKDDREKSSDFARRLNSLLRTDRVNLLTPQVMSDLERSMASWGTHGKVDPFVDMYSMIFQMTVRTISAREIADSAEECKRLEELYWKVEKGSTAASLLLPWLPSEARKQRTAATGDMYVWFDRIIKARKDEDRRENDALQALIDMGDSTSQIIQTTLGALYTGILNTGLMSAWIFIFLDQEPEWKDKVVAEIRSLLDKYAPLSQGYETPTERLSVVPFEAWENEMPTVELCTRETIRLVLNGAALRRVIHGELEIDGKVIPNGTFLTYPLPELHHSPEFYPDPMKFKPSRHLEKQEKAPHHVYLGWGAGRHPCPGRRFAQYEIKAICSMFLASYDYEIVNSKGVQPDPSTTVPDYNNLYQARPSNETFYIRYTKRESPS